MQSEDILFDLFKRNLDTRRTVIMAALAAVIAFGAWVVQQVSAERPLFDFGTGVGNVHFAVSTTGILAAWGIYLYMIKTLDCVIDTTLDRLFDQAKLPGEDKAFVSLRLSKNAKWLPLVLGVGVWIGLAGADFWRFKYHGAPSEHASRLLCTPET